MSKRIGVAMWHYPHRTTTENACFFADCGYDVLGLNQWQIIECILKDSGVELAKIISDKKVGVTVHGGMPRTHKTNDVEDFKNNMKLIGEWQKKYKFIDVISFDVFRDIRDNVSEYVDFILNTVPECKVALEDFGLNENELSQIDKFKANDRFGYLIDIGHMYIRLSGNPARDSVLLKHCPFEGERSTEQGHKEFITAIKSKTFPVFELHLHNNDGRDDLHNFLDDGTLDIKMIANVLNELNYEGIVTIESAPGFRFECESKQRDERIINDLKYWSKVYK